MTNLAASVEPKASIDRPRLVFDGAWLAGTGPPLEVVGPSRGRQVARGSTPSGAHVPPTRRDPPWPSAPPPSPLMIGGRRGLGRKVSR